MSLNMTNITRACMVYCEGELLEIVQLSNIFNDSKTFVDMPMKYDPETILSLFYNISDPYNTTVLTEFINNNFFPAGSDLDDWIPSDFITNPVIIDQITDPIYRVWASDLNQLWLVLGRQVNESVVQNPQRHSFLPRKSPMIVPGGRFRESYYWDSWWIIRGLLVCNMHATALDVINNLLDDVTNFGFVPNGGRIYYIDRSQPPLLSEMVLTYLNYMESTNGTSTGLTNFMTSSYDVLQQEYAWWMNVTNGHVAEVTMILNSTATTTMVLNRYYSNYTTPRPESYEEDYDTAQEIAGESGQLRFYHSVRAGAETGWDFSSRWIRKQAANSTNTIDPFDIYLLKNIRTSEVVPADLNAIMYRFELNLAQLATSCAVYAESIGDYANYSMYTAQSEIYAAAASARQTAIQSILWDPVAYCWKDYNMTSGMFTNNSVSIASWVPVWGGYGSDLVPSRDAQTDSKLVQSLVNSNLLQDAGVLTTNVDSSQQWDSPNAWAPLVMFTIEGLQLINSSESWELSVRKNTAVCDVVV
jgi:alpha,alpha-trehalase